MRAASLQYAGKYIKIKKKPLVRQLSAKNNKKRSAVFRTVSTQKINLLTIFPHPEFTLISVFTISDSLMSKF